MTTLIPKFDFKNGGSTPTGAVNRTIYEKLSEYISVKDFGAVGDGTTDDTTAIQNAINYAISQNGKAVFLPVGTYKITSTLIINVTDSYVSTRLIGENASSVNPTTGAVIQHTTVTNNPALVIQGARHVSVENIQFNGPNVFSLATSFFNASDFTNGSCRDTQYSPQCAIAVDPFASSVPADGGYPALTSYYSGSPKASSHVVVKDCVFRWQIVGIAMSPGGLLEQNDFGEISGCTFMQNKVGISLGQIQIKGLQISHIFADYCYTVVDTWTYSDREGSAGFTWDGGTITRSTYLIRTLNQYYGNFGTTEQLKISRIYMESTWSIGFIGNGLSYKSMPASFTDCFFWFTNTDATHATKDAHLTNFGPLKFNNCFIAATDATDWSISHPVKMYHASYYDQVSEMLFENCKLKSSGNGILFNPDYINYIKMKSCSMYSPEFRSFFNDVYNTDTLTSDSNQSGGFGFYRKSWPGSEVVAGSAVYRIKNGYNSAAFGQITITKTNGTATFTGSSTQILVGDAIYMDDQILANLDGTTFQTTWALGTVTSVPAGTGTVTVTGVGENALNGDVRDAYIKWYPTLHPASTISTTSGSTVVTITATASWPWYDNQRILSANLAAGTYIVSGTYPYYVLSIAATGTASGTRCYDADALVYTTTAL